MKYVAFLRGINIVGKNTVKMDDLRSIFATLGFKGVKTYINSGNVIFETRKTPRESLESKIKKALESNLSMDIKVMIRNIGEIVDLLDRNPFQTHESDGHEVFVVFLSGDLTVQNERQLLDQNCAAEEFAVSGPNVFCRVKKAYPDSLLGKMFIEKKLKAPSTIRNIRTVRKIAEL